MKTKNIKRAVAGLVMFLAFAIARAQITPVITTTAACHNNDGSAIISATGVTGSLYIYISGGNIFQADSGVSSATFPGLAPGQYQYSIYSNNADTSGTFTIPSTVSVQMNTTEPVCPSGTTGSATANVTGGSGPYTYLWSNSATTQSVIALVPGLYWVTVTDQNGCFTIGNDTVQIVSPVISSIAHAGSTCAGTLTVSATGGTTPYTYIWNTGATTASITGLTANTNYAATVTDANGCQGISYAYTSNIDLVVDSATSQTTAATCGANGSATVVMATGTSPFTYLWSNGETTNPATSLPGGYYTVAATDANGCTGMGWFWLADNSVNVSITSTTSPNCGEANGSITLSPSGGTQPYSYTWSYSSSNHTNSATSLTTGTYGYTITDANSCTYSNSTSLAAHGSFIASVNLSPTSCVDSIPTGSATATVTNGGTPPFTYYWVVYGNVTNRYDTTSTSILGGLPYGAWVYLNLVTDASGCSDSFTYNIDSGYIDYAPTCYDHITGYVYTDLNGNCVKDQGEPGLEGFNVEAIGSSSYYYANTDSNGFYDIQVLAGTYNVVAYTYNSGYCNSSSCTSSYTDTLTGTGTVSTGNNFGFSATSSFDLGVHPGYSSSVPGSSKEYWIYYYNRGTTSVNNVVLTFIHDSNLTLTATSPPYSSYDAATYTITWNIGTVPVSWWNSSQQVTMEFNVPSTLPLGTLLSGTSIISPITGDCNPVDNSETLTDLVTASHDPNVKEVSPAGNITAADSVLNYTIRFQNTGNATATRIIIVDTLSPLVNPASVVVGASSSHYTYTLTGNGILTFTFDPTYLPDSSHGVDSGTGFVMYSVTIRNTDALGSQIKNTASIYFDLNPAIVTNTTVNTVSLTSGIRNITSGEMRVSVNPNPVHDISLVSIEGATGEVRFELADVTGKKIFETSTTADRIPLESGRFAPGMYIYTARDIKGNTCSGKVVIVH